jgi:hypothetical protein
VPGSRGQMRQRSPRMRRTPPARLRSGAATTVVTVMAAKATTTVATMAARAAVAALAVAAARPVAKRHWSKY